MEIKEINVSDIKPDPNQPRKTFDKDKIKQLSQTYKTQGVINAIEIDENNIIITGERRYRASKLAGLKTIPCKIIKGLSESDKFERQIVENLHLSELNDYEKKKAWWRLYEMLYPEETKFYLAGTARSGENNKFSEFARRIGVKSHHTIIDAFNSLEFIKRVPEATKLIDEKGRGSYLIGEVIGKTKEGFSDKERLDIMKECKEEKATTIDKVREKIKDIKVEKQAKEILEQKDLNKKLIQSKTWVNNFRSSVTDSNQILEKTFKMLLVATKFVTIMDDTQKQRLNHDLDRLTNTLQKGEKMADKIKEMIE